MKKVIEKADIIIQNKETLKNFQQKVKKILNSMLNIKEDSIKSNKI